MNKFYIMILIEAFFVAFSQIMLKISAKKKHRNKIFEYANCYVILSYIILAGTLVLTSYVIRYISIASTQAINCASYFFVLLMDKIILKEKITLNMIFGNVIILLGIIVVVL